MCLAFQILFRMINHPFTHSPLVSWAIGLTSSGWIYTSHPLPLKDVSSFLSRITHLAARLSGAWWRHLELNQDYDRPLLSYLLPKLAPKSGKIFPHNNRLDDYRNRFYTGSSAMPYSPIELRLSHLISPTHDSMLGNRDFTMVACDSINASLNSKQLPDWWAKRDLNPHAFRQRYLKPSCMPIPSFAQICSDYRARN